MMFILAPVARAALWLIWPFSYASSLLSTQSSVHPSFQTIHSTKRHHGSIIAVPDGGHHAYGVGCTTTVAD
ncbi:hypothetical protein F4861DRAFT_497857 [Xylaria intraflava]|nr:hypothetical protein F4861DRAFT_497857 [Xylaria intraflava]